MIVITPTRLTAIDATTCWRSSATQRSLDHKSGNTGRDDAGTAQRRAPTAPECESPEGEDGSDRAEQANDGDSATGCLFDGFQVLVKTR